MGMMTPDFSNLKKGDIIIIRLGHRIRVARVVRVNWKSHEVFFVLPPRYQATGMICMDKILKRAADLTEVEKLMWDIK
jgi:hypothetical protein